MIEGGSSFVRSRQSNNGTCAEKEPRTLLDWTMMMSPWPAFSIGAAAVCCFCSLLSTIYKNTNKVMNRSELIKYRNVLLAAEGDQQASKTAAYVLPDLCFYVPDCTTQQPIPSHPSARLGTNNLLKWYMVYHIVYTFT